MYICLQFISRLLLFFFFNDTATTEIYTLSLHDALPISLRDKPRLRPAPEGTAASPLPGVALRGAVLADVPALEQLMAPYVATGDLLPRSNYDLCRHIKEYVVAEGPTGEVIGCGSLKGYSRDLAELAALAVREDWLRAVVGGALLAALLAEARAQGLAEVLTLIR